MVADPTDRRYYNIMAIVGIKEIQKVKFFVVEKHDF
jgi:hypothetical protein